MFLAATLLFQYVSCQTTADSGAEVPISAPTDTQTEFPSSSDIVSFTKRAYYALGDKGQNIKDIATNFKGEYETLNYDGKLGEKLWGLYEMRWQDLQIAVKHATQFKEFLDLLSAPMDTGSNDIVLVDTAKEAKTATADNNDVKVSNDKKAAPPLKVQAAQAALSSAQSTVTADAKIPK